MRNLPISGEKLAQFCHKYQISELSLFGSALRADFNTESDLDFLVTFLPQADWSLFDHISMEGELSDLFGRRVDLVSKRALERSKNWLRRQEILESAEVIYAA